MFSVSAELVEIDAVCAGMGEHAVKDNIYTVCFGLFAQMLKILVRAEHRVDMLIAGGRIAVIFVRLENRVEINAGNA